MTLGPPVGNRWQLKGFLQSHIKGQFTEVARVRETYKGWWGAPKVSNNGEPLPPMGLKGKEVRRALTSN